MACFHKFSNYLQLDAITFKPEILIIGTFNPEWPVNNQASWFYGRTHNLNGVVNNNFWDVLPRLYNQESLLNGIDHDWKTFCKKHKIAITDLIVSIEDADEQNLQHQELLGGYADNVIADNFNDFQFTDIISILENHPSIKKVYITNGVNGTFWTALWRPIVQYCNRNNIQTIKLLTPSKNARFSMFSWNKRNRENQYSLNNLNDFILMKWQQVW